MRSEMIPGADMTGAGMREGVGVSVEGGIGVSVSTTGIGGGGFTEQAAMRKIKPTREVFQRIHIFLELTDFAPPHLPF